MAAVPFLLATLVALPLAGQWGIGSGESVRLRPGNVLAGYGETSPELAVRSRGERRRAQLQGSRFMSQRNANDMRFREMDRNNDGVITESEWRGSRESFRVHDWNGDGVLSGDEVRPGAKRDTGNVFDQDFEEGSSERFTAWTERGFANLDHNRDGRITSNEWHYDEESFRRADRNRDGILSRSEFLGSDIDDDREDRFENLDANSNGRIERSEWHGSADAFDGLDRNNDNVLTRAEVAGNEDRRRDRFANLDINRDGTLSRDEWHWSARSFDQQDINRDGLLTRAEFSGRADGRAVGTSGQTIRVDAKERWTDTGVTVRAGDIVTLEAEGSVGLSGDPKDLAGPAGSRTNRRAPDAPVQQELAGALIAKIGDSAPMLASDRRSFTAPATGRLYLGVNDDHLADNSGEFRVMISIRGR
jgi:Ca2+-binding EF-hand superfamily protein